MEGKLMTLLAPNEVSKLYRVAKKLKKVRKNIEFILLLDTMLYFLY